MTESATDIAPRRRLGVTQEGVVSLIAGTLFVVFAATLNKFLSTDNLVSLVKNVAILGTLAIGMGLVVVGRGIDLAMIATMVIGVSLGIGIAESGLSFVQGLSIGLGLVCLIGLCNGVLIAYADIPAIFTTLAMGSIVYGLGRSWFALDVLYVPNGNPWVGFVGRGTLLGLPIPIYVFAVLALVVHLLLRYTRFGRFVYATGDNPAAARTVGVPTRVVIVAQYVASSLIAYLAGIILMSLVSSMNTKLYSSTLVYDVLLVVVLGGIGLNGGRGGVRNILVGTGLVGILVNGMTILSLSYTAQNLIKSVILLAAILIDSLINPRDEQTSQHGDI